MDIQQKINELLTDANENGYLDSDCDHDFIAQELFLTNDCFEDEFSITDANDLIPYIEKFFNSP